MEDKFEGLVHQLLSEDKNQRVEAAFNLGKLGSLAAVKPLIIALKDPEASVRFHAAEALGKLGDPSAIPALQNLAQEASFQGNTAREARYKARKAIKFIRLHQKEN